MEGIASAICNHRHVGGGLGDMRLDRENIAKLRDWIDLEAFRVANDDGLEPFASAKMDRSRMTQLFFPSA